MLPHKEMFIFSAIIIIFGLEVFAFHLCRLLAGSRQHGGLIQHLVTKLGLRKVLYLYLVFLFDCVLERLGCSGNRSRGQKGYLDSRFAFLEADLLPQNGLR